MTSRIELKGLKFFSHHGLYEEETKNGGWYLVDVSFNCDTTQAVLNDDIEGTINYEAVYKIVKEEMVISSKLIENVAARIHHRLAKEIYGISELLITLKKLQAPLGGELDYVSITLS